MQMCDLYIQTNDSVAGDLDPYVNDALGKPVSITGQILKHHLIIVPVLINHLFFFSAGCIYANAGEM